MTKGFDIATRPTERKLHQRGTGFSAALRQTLTDGQAVHVPVTNGESYAVLRNRKAPAGYLIARGLGARLIIDKAPDGGLLIWLEPKA